MKSCRFRCVFHLRKWRALADCTWHVSCRRCGRFIAIAVPPSDDYEGAH